MIRRWAAWVLRRELRYARDVAAELTAELTILRAIVAEATDTEGKI